jgi:hypothetical protein
MKNLMRGIVTTIICLTCSQVYGQKYGIKAGMNFANMLAKDNSETYDDIKMKTGFHIGFIMEHPISEILSVESGLLLSTKGMKIEENIFGIDMTAVTNLYYIDVPVALKASYDLGKGNLYLSAGPYIGMGISGKIKMTLEYEGEKETEEEKIEWGNDEDNDDLLRLDAGLALGCGVEIGATQLGVQYDLGLANLSSYTGEGSKINNRVLRISLAYRFGEF